MRELEHALEYASIMCRQDEITVEHLPPELAACPDPPPGPAGEEGICTAAIMQALEKAGGNKSKAARMLGISRRTIYRRLDSGTA